uniref:Uncharacterized protein n=1 Tax=Sphaerodactylus townsendi TaxID=933632 RepID=A0ACB8FGX5_9SAUR
MRIVPGPSDGALAAFHTGAASGGGQQRKYCAEASSRRRPGCLSVWLPGSCQVPPAQRCLGKVRARGVQAAPPAGSPSSTASYKGRAACSLGGQLSASHRPGMPGWESPKPEPPRIAREA